MLAPHLPIPDSQLFAGVPSATATLAAAIDLFRAGRYAEAEACCRRIVEANPNDGEAFNLLGALNVRLGRPLAAIDMLRRATALLPTAAGVFFNLGLAHRARDNGAEAVAAFRRAGEMDPALAPAHLYLGLTLARLGRFEEAAPCLHRAVDAGTADAELLWPLSVVLHVQGQHAAAEAGYRRLIDLRPDDAMSLTNLGSILKARGRTDEALAFYRRALALAPDRHPEIHNNICLTLDHSGRYDEAIQAARAGIALHPDRADLHCRLGSALQGADRHHEALAAFRCALSLSPGLPEAKAGYGRAIHSLGGIDPSVLTSLRDKLAEEGLDDAGKFYWVLTRAFSHLTEVLKRDFMRGHDGRVMAGPFAGMVYLPRSAEGCYLPKILGSYEAALHPHVAAAAGRGYQAVVNIGSADGYYAVGFARLLPEVRVHAYDINLQIHEACRRLAELNGVSDRVSVGGAFRGEDFAAFADRRTLVFCDIEGGEDALLDPARYPALTGMDVMVELHDCHDPTLSRRIVERFAATHDIVVLSSAAATAPLPPALAGRSDLEQFAAQWEARPGPTPWGVMIARHPSPLSRPAVGA